MGDALLDDHTWVVIAAYNESRGIGDVVAGVKALGHHVVVVDDGSSDRTGDISLAAGATVLRHLINLGQGASLQTGIEYALTQGAEKIITFDADGQHHADDIDRMCIALELHRVDFALGSRFLGETINMPRNRRLLLTAAVWFTRLTTKMRVTDTHNGLRGMTARGAAKIHLRQNRMAHASEILDQVRRSRLKYVEVPVTIEYNAYTLEKGQKNADFAAILFDLFMGALQR